LSLYRVISVYIQAQIEGLPYTMGFVTGAPLEVLGLVGNTRQQVRESVGIRRAAVRAAPAGQPIGPSEWEHVEVLLPNGGERISSLKLEAGGTFSALVQERCEGELQLEDIASSHGNWVANRRGLELVFPDDPQLQLSEHRVAYELRRGCLVATQAVLPDGLDQEYSVCNAASGRSLQAISNAASDDEEAEVLPLQPNSSLEVEASARRPVGIIRDGSSSSLSSAGSLSELVTSGRQAEQATQNQGLPKNSQHSMEAGHSVPPAATPDPETSNDTTHAVEDENSDEYADDFEQASENGHESD